MSSGDSASSAVNLNLNRHWPTNSVSARAISPGDAPLHANETLLKQTSSFIAFDEIIQSPFTATISPGRCHGQRFLVLGTFTRSKPNLANAS